MNLATIKTTYRLFVVNALFVFLIICGVTIFTTQAVATHFTSASITDSLSKISGVKFIHLLSSENVLFQTAGNQKNSNFFSLSSFFQATTNIVWSNQRSFLGNELPGFSRYDDTILLAEEETNFTNNPDKQKPADSEKAKPDNDGSVLVKAIEPPKTETPANPSKTNEKVVQIYFSHTREAYASSKVKVTHVGDKMAAALERKGIGTAVDKTDIGAILVKKKKSYGKSYQESRKVVETAMSKNHALEYFIDIHRDSQPHKITTLTKNGKNYAKIAFVIGGKNPNYQKNLALAKALHSEVNKIIPKLSRGVIKKSGEGANGLYNQDLSENAFLIEVGGVDNTLEELTRTADVFAEAFSKYFWNAEAVNKQSNKQAK